MLHRFFISLFLGAFVSCSLAADDPRVVKTVIADKINIASGAVSGDDLPGVGGTKNIFVSPNGMHVAMRLHTSKNPDKFSLWIDGKAGRVYDSVSEIQWDPRGQFLFIGKRNGKAYVVRDGQENNFDVADDIAGLAPHPLEIRDFVAPAKAPPKDNDLPGLDTLLGEDPNAPIYGAKQNGLWMLRGDGKVDGENHWTGWLHTWPNGQFGTPSAVYEVSDAKSATALVRDGKTLGPRSSWGLNEEFIPVWSVDGTHVLFCVENNKINYLCLDGNAITEVPDCPTIHWSNDNRRFAVFGTGIKTSVLSVGADGKAKADVSNDWNTLEDIDNKNQTGVVWSKEGTHFAAINETKEPATVWRDGVETGPLPPVPREKDETDQDREGRKTAAMFNTGGVIVPLLAWNPTGSHLAVACNGELDNGLYLDEKFIGKAGAFASLTWTHDGEQPVAIARDDEFADIVPISTWSLKSGKDTIDFALSSEENTDIPLTSVSSPSQGVYRIVMLERRGKPENDKTDDELAQIVRYDIKLGR